MAKAKHIKILKSGVNSWNEWRIKNPEVIPDLSAVNLSNLDLRNINFSRANLENANLRNSTLKNADLSNAILKKSNCYGVDAEGANFNLAIAEGARFKESKLIGANLQDANFKNSNLNNVQLNGAIVTGIELHGADMTGADKSFSNWSLTIWGAPQFPQNYPATPLELIVGLSPRTRRIIADAQYLRLLWDTSHGWKRFVLRLWGITSGFGQSLIRWLLTSLLLVFIFALIILKLDFYVTNFHFKDCNNGSEPVLVAEGQIVNPSIDLAIYYSLGTFTALGFGDVAPVTGWGRFWICLEVFVGYIMLGAVVAIFTNKLARLSL